MAPAAINKDMPPSIGIQGGGQHPGTPPAGGGGGGPAKHMAVKPNVNINNNINLVVISCKLSAINV